MSTLQIVLGGLVVALLLAWLWLRRRRGGALGSDRAQRAEKASDRLDTITGWPPQATRALSSPERTAFGILVRALPDCMVLAQMPLSRFINVSKRNSYAEWLRRIGYQSVDFVICDMSAQVIAVVELEPPQQSERARKRVTRITRTLKAAQVPLHIWRESALPSVDAAREALLRHAAATSEAAQGGAVAVAATAAAAPATAQAPSPFEDAGRDSTQDERIELLEPPPSTWYDEIDSDPAPLSKR